MTKRKAPPKIVDRPKTPLPNLAAWLRRMADHADKGNVIGFAGVVMEHGGFAATNIADPCGPDRLTLAGTVAQLHHMLQASEFNDRMSSLARQPDPGPQSA